VLLLLRQQHIPCAAVDASKSTRFVSVSSAPIVQMTGMPKSSARVSQQRAGLSETLFTRDIGVTKTPVVYLGQKLQSWAVGTVDEMVSFFSGSSELQGSPVSTTLGNEHVRGLAARCCKRAKNIFSGPVGWRAQHVWSRVILSISAI
jgi:hypothetical protein